eukprot:7334375-Alexandrium_andersonii.AAC.1
MVRGEEERDARRVGGARNETRAEVKPRPTSPFPGQNRAGQGPAHNGPRPPRPEVRPPSREGRLRPASDPRCSESGRAAVWQFRKPPQRATAVPAKLRSYSGC